MKWTTTAKDMMDGSRYKETSFNFHHFITFQLRPLNRLVIDTRFWFKINLEQSTIKNISKQKLNLKTTNEFVEWTESILASRLFCDFRFDFFSTSDRHRGQRQRQTLSGKQKCSRSSGILHFNYLLVKYYSQTCDNNHLWTTTTCQ